MKKKLATWLLTMSVLLIPGITVSAANNTSFNEYKGAITDEYEKDNDPLYEKYHSKEYLNAVQNAKTFTVGKSNKISWGKGLTHDAQHSESKKSYGIDVSKWNGKIDWKKVKEAGVDFAIIRLGYRGEAKGTLTVDPWYEYNIVEADKAGLKVGVYFYTQAITEKEAKAEADFCAKYLESYKTLIDFPVMYDIENTAKDRMGKAKLNTKTRTSLCLGFCSQIEKKGYKGGVYSYKAYFNDKLTMSEIDPYYYIWLAEWKKTPTYTGKYKMWQYSDGNFDNKNIISYKVPGISGALDLDVAYDYVPAKVKGVKYKSSSDSSLAVSWAKVKSADGYEIRVFDSNDKLIKTQKVNGTSGSVKDLPAGTQYKVGVRAYYYFENTDTYAYGATSSRIVIYTHPAQITDLVQKSATSNSIHLSWSKMKGATGYKIYTYNKKTKKYTRHAVIKSNSYTMKGLSTGTQYNFAVIAYKKYNSKEYNGPVSKLYVGTTNAYKLTGFKQGKVTADSVALSWKKQKSATGYRVYTYNSKGKLLNHFDTTKAAVTKKELASASVYSFKVRSFIKTSSNAVAYGPYTSAIQLKTCPDKVEGLKVKSAGKDSVTYSWNKVKGAAGYYVYKYNNSTKKFTRIEISSKYTSFTWKKLNATTPYTIRVAAFTKFGKTQIRSEISKNMTAYTTPGKVTGLKLTGGKNSNSITLKWNAVKKVTGYRIFRYNEKGKLIATFDVKGTSHTFKNLAAGNYVYKVRARCSSANYHSLGAFSNSVASYVAPAKIMNLTLADISAEKATIKWNGQEGVEGYFIMMYDDAAGSYKQIGVANTNSYTLEGLSANKTYRIKLVGYITHNNKKVKGKESDVISFTTSENAI